MPLVAASRRRRLAAGRRRAAGAEAVRGTWTAEGVGEGDRGVAARRRRRVHRVARRRRNGWQIVERRRRRRRAPGAAGRAAHRHPVPALRQLRRGRHAPVHRRHRGARHPAPARRRQGVSRSRRGRDDPRGAGGHRMARRRAVGVRDAARDRSSPIDDEHAARVPASVRRASSVPGAARARRQLRAGACADRRADDPSDCRSPTALRLLQQLHRRRNYRPVADTIGRLLAETRAHVGFILRPAGEQALANVLHVAELARQYEAGGGISFRGFIDELRDGGGVRGGRSADSRREQRRRAADDRAQGQGPRVSGRHPRRPDLPAEPRRREPVPRRRAAASAR